MLICCMLRGNCSSLWSSLLISTLGLRYLYLYTFIGCDVYGSYFLMILCGQSAYWGVSQDDAQRSQQPSEQRDPSDHAPNLGH